MGKSRFSGRHGGRGEGGRADAGIKSEPLSTQIKAAREYAPRLAETLGPTNCFGATPAPKRPGSFPMSSTSQRLGRASMEAVLGRVLCGHAPDLRFLGRRTEQIEHTLGKHF